MSPRRSFFALLAGMLLPPTLAADRWPQGLDVEAMLAALAAVESGNDPLAVGRAGERGRCQLLPATWREVSRLPFHVWAHRDCPETRDVERAALARTCAALIRRGHLLEPALVAAAWRFGPAQAARFIRADSAQRTANLYWDELRRRQGGGAR